MHGKPLDPIMELNDADIAVLRQIDEAYQKGDNFSVPLDTCIKAMQQIIANRYHANIDIAFLGCDSLVHEDYYDDPMVEDDTYVEACEYVAHAYCRALTGASLLLAGDVHGGYKSVIKIMDTLANHPFEPLALYCENNANAFADKYQTVLEVKKDLLVYGGRLLVKQDLNLVKLMQAIVGLFVVTEKLREDLSTCMGDMHDLVQLSRQ